MADPFSVAGSAVGVVSLGLAVCGTLVRYVQSIEGRHQAIKDTLSVIENLRLVFIVLKPSLESIDQQGDTAALPIHTCLVNCEGKVRDLEQFVAELEGSSSDGSIVDKIKDAGKAIVYPFQEDKLEALKESVDSLVKILHLSISSANLHALYAKNICPRPCCQEPRDSVPGDSDDQAPAAEPLLEVPAAEPRLEVPAAEPLLEASAAEPLLEVPAAEPRLEAPPLEVPRSHISEPSSSRNPPTTLPQPESLVLDEVENVEEESALTATKPEAVLSKLDDSETLLKLLEGDSLVELLSLMAHTMLASQLEPGGQGSNTFMRPPPPHSTKAKRSPSPKSYPRLSRFKKAMASHSPFTLSLMASSYAVLQVSREVAVSSMPFGDSSLV